MTKRAGTPHSEARPSLARERTGLAWQRTGLACLVANLGLARLIAHASALAAAILAACAAITAVGTAFALRPASGLTDGRRNLWLTASVVVLGLGSAAYLGTQLLPG